jgi:AcrR family transcriptional regulator
MAKRYTRLVNDERRRRLLDLGEELFTRHPYHQLSMAQIAREAGLSKALLYHYFPSKQEYFAATLAQGAAELQATVEPDPDLAPVEALTHSLDAYLAWIDGHAAAYRTLLESAASIPEVRDLVAGLRAETGRRIVAGLDADTPAARTAVQGWLWFMDGACLHWLDHRDLERDVLRDLLLTALVATLAAAGAAPAGLG